VWTALIVSFLTRAKGPFLAPFVHDRAQMKIEEIAEVLDYKAVRGNFLAQILPRSS
jgi:hypothetical protein